MARNDELAQEVEALRERFLRLNQAMLRMSGSIDDPDTVLQEVVDGARSLMRARYGAFLSFEDSGLVQDFIVSGVTDAEIQRVGGCPEGTGLLAHLNELEEPLRLADISKNPRAAGLPEHHPPVKTFLGTQVRVGEESLGNLYFSDKEDGEEFTDDDERILVMFASQAALVIANARRFREERRARSGLETLMDTSPIGVVVFDARSGVPLSFNREAMRMVDGLRNPGQSAEQLLEVVSFRRADGREKSLTEFPLAESLQTGEKVRAEEIVIGVPDGRRITVLVNATPIHSSESEVETVVVTLQDLTALEELDMLRAEFLAVVSHELRAPLTSIKGSTATVMGASSTFGHAEMMQYFRIIDEQADQMNVLIRDLLDVALIRMGTLPVNPEPVQVAALVDEARTTFQSGESQHNIRIYLPPDLPRVMADPRRVVQVLENLLSNAARHSPRSSTIRVRAECEDLQVALSVEDRGRGLSADRLSQLFRKFSRLEEDDGGDTGLGLAICKGIVEAHGGRIWAESDGLDRGTKLTFTIPVAENPSPGPTTGSTRPADGFLHREERMRILAVDDDPQTLRYLNDALTRAGYAPVVTGDPAEAINFMESMVPHLVLLDLMLPGTDGIKLMKEIRSMASDIPIIFLSAYGQEDVVAKAFDGGADDYVIKPFSSTELAARIRAALRKRVYGQSEPSEPYVRGKLKVDFAERKVSLACRPVRLTAIEYRLLVELAVNAGRTLTYNHLFQRVWRRRSDGDLRTMRSAIKSLRRKLGDDASDPTFIFTESRVGYRMAEVSTATTH